MIRVLAALAAIVALAAATPQTTLPDVEDEVMCVECGTALNVSTAPVAERQRAFIRARVDRCESKSEVKAALVAEFGPDVLGAPSDEGANVAAYLVPALAVALAGAGIGAAALRWRRTRRTSASAASAAPDGEAAARLEADLRRYDL